jgi:two-component system, cell cycle sensor histidine kinase and response regulator CckA
MDKRLKTDPDTSSGNSARQSAHIQAELIHLNYKQSPIGITITAINGAALTFLLWHHIPHQILGGWFAALLAVAAMRSVLVYSYRRQKVPIGRSMQWGRLNIIGLAVTGVLWGATMVLTFPAGSLTHQLCIALLLCGIIATGISLYGVVPSAVIAFSLPIFLAWIIRFLTFNDPIHIVIAGMAVLYLGITVFTSHHIARVRRQLLVTRFNLANRVTEKTQELKETNAYLQTEIKERKNIEERLRQERDRLETITTTIGAGLAVISKKDRILWSNRIFKEIFGGESDGPCYHQLYQRDSLCEACGARQIFNQECVKVVQERKVKDAADRTLWFQIITTPIHNTDGRIRAALEMVIPITERKEAEAAQRRMSEKLEEARKTEAIANLAGGIAHQFNNALAVIAGNVELMEYDYRRDPQISTYAKPIISASKKMTGLTSQLLAYASGGKYKDRPSDLGEVVETTVGYIQHTFPNQTSLEIKLTPHLPKVSIDTTQIQMVVTSIVSNAIEATGDKGSICLLCEAATVTSANRDTCHNIPPGRYVALTIVDNGVGMDRKTLKRIFEPFFTTKFEGRGLGMAAVYGIIKNHNGYIFVTSRVEEGTEVTIYLPALGEVPEPITDLDTTPVQGRGTVLMVEDDTDLIDVTQALLKRIGYKVIIATTAHEAIEIIDHTTLQFNAVLLDIVLPDMDGAAVYPHIRKNRPQAKVIVCTGFGQDGSTRELLDAGADDFLQKPFTLNQISKKLSQVLSLSTEA